MKIYLVAPSFGCTTFPYEERLHNAIKKLNSLGYEIIKGPNIFKNEGICSSNSPELRAQEIEQAFQSDADVILSVGGGEVMCEILPYLNFEIIKNNPKVFCGFSDNTNLTFTITTITNLETIYGANAPSFYDINYDTLDTLRMLNNEVDYKGYLKYELYPDKINALSQLNLTEDKVLTLYNYHDFEGIMLGGCLDCLITLCGTKFDNVKNYIKDKKIIWYLESCDLSIIAQRRAFFQLKNANWFDTVSGFIIGRPLNKEDYFGIDYKDNIIDSLKEFNVPIIIDADLGHLSPSLPFRNGREALVQVYDNNIYIKYKE